MGGKAVHILLVDDNEDHVELMRRSFDGAAFDVQLSVADSLAGAQRMLAEATPDIMITDYRLPDGEGMALLPGDADRRSMPIVLLTGHGDETVAATAIRAGALDYIVKSDDTLNDVAHIVERSLREWQHILDARNAEKALRESEAKYHDLYDNAPDMFASVEAATAHIIECNRTLATRLGYSKEEIIGRPVFELYHEDCMDEVKQVFRSFVETGVVHDRKLQLKTKDGEAVHVRLNSSAVRDDDGTVLYSRSVWRDISDTWKAEVELEKSRNRFVMAQGVGHVGIWEWYLRTDEVFWSDETYRILGLSPGERWPNLELFLEYVHADDRPVVRQAFDAALHGLESYKSLDIHVVRRDGAERCVSITGKVIPDADGKPLSIIGTIQDISERKKSERALDHSRANLARAEGIGHIGNWSYDVADGDIKWSDEVWRIFDRKPQSSGLSYEVFRPWLREDYREFHDALMVRMSQLEPGESIAPYGFCLIRPDGEERWVSITQETEFDQQGKPARFFGIIQDVTGRKQAEDALKESEKKYRLLFENMMVGFALHDIICDGQGKPVDYRFVEANPAFEKLTGIPVADLAGKTVLEVLPGTEPVWIEIYGKVALTGEPTSIEHFARELNRHYDVWAFSPRRGQFATLFHDITDRKRQEILLQSRIRLSEMSGKVDHQQLMQATLDIAEELTGSTIGFFHFVDEDQEGIALQAWSSNTIEHMCTAEGAGIHYPVSQAGVWADAIRQRKSVIHNDLAHLEGRKGMPEGHAAVQREICVPVMRENRVVAVIGVGNKACDYDDKDADMLSQLATLVWEMIAIKRAGQTLRESEARFRAVFESAMIGNLFWDADGRITDANDAALNMLGYTRDEIHSRTVRWPDITPPEYKEQDDKALQEIIDTGVMTPVEKEYVRRDGSRIPVLLGGAALPGGNATHGVSFILDISERRQAEQRLNRERDFSSTMVNTAQMIVLVLNPDASIRYFNPFMEAVSGYRIAEVRDKDWFDIFLPQQERNRVHALFAKVLASEVSAAGNINAILTKDGRLRQIEWHERLISDSDGQVMGLLSIGQDITERLEAEEALRQAERRYRAIVENSFVPYALNDEQQNITFLNKAFVDTFGYTLEDIPTLDAWWLRAYPEPEYRQWVAAAWQAGMDKAKRNAACFEPIELKICCKDGSTRIAMVGATPLSESFAGIHLVTFFDITERKQVENELKHKFEELERMNKLMVGRELKMEELLREIERLKGEGR